MGHSTISMDEYILICLIKLTYPKANVLSQYKWGRKYIDIFVEDGKRRFFLEFHGPGHFKKLSVYKDPENPFVLKKQIEEETKVFFGEFFFDNSAQIICDISSQFNALPDGDCGYFYEEWNENSGRIKEEHPIINRILSVKAKLDLLIPKGVQPEEKSKWLPQVLIQAYEISHG